MATTYEPIATTTLGSAAADITFSSIPATYTDLRVVLVGTADSAQNCYIRYNGDTATNYSSTRLAGSGTAASSGRDTSNTWALTSIGGIGASLPSMITLDVFSYAGSTNKTSLSQFSGDQNGSGWTASFVCLWRSTSAITSLSLNMNGANFNTGTTATLYGIKNA
jgi:hypothetical protein